MVDAGMACKLGSHSNDRDSQSNLQLQSGYYEELVQILGSFTAWVSNNAEL